jgi:hypothetical protein
MMTTRYFNTMYMVLPFLFILNLTNNLRYNKKFLIKLNIAICIAI